MKGVWIGNGSNGKVSAESTQVFGEHRGLPFMAELSARAQMHHEQENARPKQVLFWVEDAGGIAGIVDPGKCPFPFREKVTENLGQQNYGWFGFGSWFLAAARRFSGTWAWRIAMLSLEISTSHF